LLITNTGSFVVNVQTVLYQWC